MKFAILVYQDETALAGLSESDKLAAIVAQCEMASAWSDEIKKSGRCISCVGLQSVQTAKTVRNRIGSVSITDGPFAETKECLGGFSIIEAADMQEALQLVSKFPARILSVEVRPLMDPANELTDPFDRKIAAAIRREGHA